MRIQTLQILPQEEYFSPSNGGALSTWINECFIKNKDQIVVIAPKSKDFIKNYRIFSIPTKVLKVIGSFLGGKLGHHIKYNFYVIIAALYSKARGFKIIHIHNRPTYVPIVKRINRKSHVILHMHNDHVLDLNEKQTRQLFNTASKIICVSEYIKSGIVKHGLLFNIDFSSQLEVLYNGANPNHFQKVEIPDVNNLLFVGRLIASKGIQQLIEAVLIVLETLPDVQLFIAGSEGFGNLSDSKFVTLLKSMAKRKPQNIHFLGYVPHGEVPYLFKKSSIYIIPSIWNDPSPLAVLEGMASGIPMIVGDKGGIPEQVGDTAISIDCNNIELLAEKITFLLKDRKFGKDLAAKAYERFIQNFTWEDVQNNYSKIINTL